MLYDILLSMSHDRAAIEEQYAKNLMKLSKSTLGESEQGCVRFLLSEFLYTHSV